MTLLGVNIDHVATLRQARGTLYPDPVQAAFEAEMGGADSITVHLREDRRHIQLRDLEILMRTVRTRVNLEMAPTEEMVQTALKTRPADVCLVPERREELTTEGGLDVAGQVSHLKSVVRRLTQAEIRVSLFVDPDPFHLEAAAQVGAPVVELHTGKYAEATDDNARREELELLSSGIALAKSLGLRVHAGHGLDYHNLRPVLAMDGIEEVNIGHSIVSRGLFVGLREAVRQMKELIRVL